MATYTLTIPAGTKSIDPANSSSEAYSRLVYLQLAPTEYVVSMTRQATSPYTIQRIENISISNVRTYGQVYYFDTEGNSVIGIPLLADFSGTLNSSNTTLTTSLTELTYNSTNQICGGKLMLYNFYVRGGNGSTVVANNSVELATSVVITVVTNKIPYVQSGRYNGSSYDAVQPYYYNGSAWVPCEWKRYNGSSWDDVDTV